MPWWPVFRNCNQNLKRITSLRWAVIAIKDHQYIMTCKEKALLWDTKVSCCLVWKWTCFLFLFFPLSLYLCPFVYDRVETHPLIQDLHGKAAIFVYLSQNMILFNCYAEIRRTEEVLLSWCLLGRPFLYNYNPFRDTPFVLKSTSN